MKKILIINGHPDKEAFCTALAQRYCDSAQGSGAICQLIHLHELTFDPVLHFGYNRRTELEPDLLMANKPSGMPIIWCGFIQRGGELILR